MKKTSIMLAAVLLLSACAKDDAVVRQDTNGAFVTKTFTAACRGSKTAFVDGATSQGFTQGDRPFIYAGGGIAEGRVGTIADGDPINDTLYRTVKFEVGVPAGAQDGAQYHALIPYQERMAEGKFVLPARQRAAVGTYDSRANLIYATTTTNELRFDMACVYIRLRVASDYVGSATRFIIRSEKPLAGECNIAFAGTDFSVSAAYAGVNSDTLDNGGAAFAADTAYYAVVLPCDEAAAVSFEVQDQSGNVLNKYTMTNRTFLAGYVYTVTLGNDALQPYNFGKPEHRTTAALGEFSVSAEQKVRFSTGNLQYKSSGAAWRFAPNQWTMAGNDNNVIAQFSTKYIDLFGWGTGNNPVKNTNIVTDYSQFNEWGNALGNGEGWRTMTKAEWEYLMGRENRQAHATVHGVKGLILLPDVWTLPAGCSFSSGTQFAANTPTDSQWAAMEAAGAVFLPAAGSRVDDMLKSVGSTGKYWSRDAGYAMVFENGKAPALAGSSVCNGLSVRLVQESR